MPDEYTYPDWLPTVDDLGNFMSARTLGGGMGMSEVGTFDDTTRPTAAQAQQAIEDAADRVIPKIGDVTDMVARLAKQAVQLGAAALVEMRYITEQAVKDNSAHSLYRAEYKTLMADVIDAAMEADSTGGDPDAGDGVHAVGTFDEPGDCDAPYSWMNRVW